MQEDPLTLIQTDNRMVQSEKHLRVAVGSWPPWCALHVGADGFVEVNGIAVDIFEIIARKMNYTYTYVKADDDQWGRQLPNGTWTGLVGMNVYGKADMALGPFTVTWIRNKAVDFSSIFYFDNQGIFLPRPRVEKDLANFIRPFSSDTWIALALVLGSSIVLGLVMSHLLRQITRYKSGVKDSVQESTFLPTWIISPILNEASPTLPTSHTGRLFIGTWLIAAFIIDTAYVGILTSILAVPKVTIPVDSLEDLVSYKKIPWAIQEGTAVHQLLQQATGGIFKKVYEQRSYMVIGCYETREQVKKERIAILCDLLTMWKVIHDDFSSTGQCNYYIAKKLLFAQFLAYAFPKRSKLKGEFNHWLVPLKESGLITRKVTDSTSNATSCLRSLGRGGPAKPILEFMDLAGLFLLWIGGLSVSTITLVAEILINEMKALN